MDPQELDKLKRIYNHWLDTDPTPAEQVGWGGLKDQTSRFDQFVAIIKVTCPDKSLSILDVGCGDGALLDYLHEHLPGYTISYSGIDINERYLQRARELHPDSTFTLGDFDSEAVQGPFDYVVASGTYNINVYKDPAQGIAHLRRAIAHMVRLTRVAAIFNLLTRKDDGREVLTDDMQIYDKDTVKSLCAESGAPVTLIEGYDNHDTTFWLDVKKTENDKAVQD